MQWFYLFSFLSLAEFVWIACLEETRSHFQQPLWINGANLPHVLLGREDEFVIDDPLGVLVEQRGARVDIHLLVVNHGLVPFLRVLARSVHEEAGRDGLADTRVVLVGEGARCDHWELEPIQNHDKLLPHVLSTFQ